MASTSAAGIVVNDVHSQLNETTVREVVAVDSLEAVRTTVLRARELGVPVCIAGGRHAMGGQQFCRGGLLLDTRQLAGVIDVDAEAGIIEVEAGIQWPAVLERLRPTAWGFRQKQTGADRLSLGGAVSANGHGRGLAMKPIVADVESLQLVGPDGELKACSRDENADLFALAVGGYGLFGAIHSLRLRLAPRRKLERVVEVRELDGLMQAFEERIAAGFLYGDFQFAIAPADEAFLRRGVLSCYRPAEGDEPIPDGQRALTIDDWRRLLYLTHTDKTQAFERYAAHYLATSGQLYWSDAHQSAEYIDGYHRALDQLLGGHRATEMISELYVPRDRLNDFMEEVAEDFRQNGVDVIYGTVRLIERDDESFLGWAREPWACVIFNLHTVHNTQGIEHSADAFRRLIDLAVARRGSYFLTYHRWARRDQVEACYPQFREFLELKRRHDPGEVFQSDWYRHHVGLFSGE
jgi:FAD/FMN-containing dehydrogenase